MVNKTHRQYPCLLRELKVTRPDHVWCADITYVPMKRGSAYLRAVMDCHSRKVIACERKNTVDTTLCLGALFDAVDYCGAQLPDIFKLQTFPSGN